MRKLSDGTDSTLKNWLRLSTAFFGEESPQVAFLRKKIADSPNGEQEEVIADESQMLMLLGSMIPGMNA